MSDKHTEESSIKRETLDVRGLECPQPIIKTKAIIAGLPINQELLVIYDDLSLEIDILALVKANNYKMVSSARADNAVYCVIKK